MDLSQQGFGIADVFEDLTAKDEVHGIVVEGDVDAVVGHEFSSGAGSEADFDGVFDIHADPARARGVLVKETGGFAFTTSEIQDGLWGKSFLNYGLRA